MPVTLWAANARGAITVSVSGYGRAARSDAFYLLRQILVGSVCLRRHFLAKRPSPPLVHLVNDLRDRSTEYIIVKVPVRVSRRPPLLDLS